LERHAQAKSFEFFLQQIAPGGFVLVASQPLEVAPDVVARTGGLDEVEPVAAGAARGLGGHNLHDVAALELVIERDHAVVYFGTGTAIADLAVDAEGEIDRRRADRQVDDLALGGED